MIQIQKPELLAPAGSPACALAAFDAGADAIYAGLPKFNARERGENFSAESMGRVIQYAHKCGRKVYVTLNTLVKEQELPEIAEYLAFLSELGPDALIVQDLGVIRMAREFFPKLSLHGSTQMGIHNRAGAEVAAELGLKRVILERQLTLEEIDAIRKNSKLELEIFIHGALCCSLSGMCYFSSYLGGYSGNRGKCKQPCRRRYFSKDGNGFFFSPQDLCTAEMIGEFKKRGIASLKIEGRLRQPDYVKTTVGAYRMLLDTESDEAFREALPEARNLLGKGCGRKWSNGFFQRDSFKTLITHDSPGAAGVLLGSVEEVREKGFYFTCSRRLFLGDRIRIQPRTGDDGPALTVTRMFVADQTARKAGSGERVFVCCDKPVPLHGTVYKIGESFTDYSARIEALPPVRKKLSISGNLTEEKLSLRINNAPFGDWEYVWPEKLSPAKNRPLDAAALEAEFSASDSETFECGSVQIGIDGAYFLPSSVLKVARRAFWEKVKAELRPEAVFQDSSKGLELFRQSYQQLRPRYHLPEYLTETVSLRAGGAEPASRKAIRAMSVYEFNKLAREVILPEFCPGEKLASVEKAIANARACGIRRFRIPSLYALALYRKEEGETLLISSPLPVTNSLAALELARFGADRVMAHIELEKAAVEDLRDRSPVPVELYRLGRPAILTTRAEIPVSGDIHDGRNNRFVVRYEHKDGLTRVYPGAIFSIPRLNGVYDFYDMTNAHWNAADTTEFNYSGMLF